MSVRLLLSMMIAVALGFAPFAMPMGEASAAPAAGHHEGMAKAGHCDDMPAPAKSDSHKENLAAPPDAWRRQCFPQWLKP